MEATWQIVIYQFKWFIIETRYLEFAINKECGRQPKAFDRSITNAPNAVPWSTLCFHISVSAIRQCWTQCFFLEKISSKNLEICWHKDLSKFFEKFGKILTGRYLFLSHLWPFSYTGVRFTIFKQEGNLHIYSNLLNSLKWISEKISQFF